MKRGINTFTLSIAMTSSAVDRFPLYKMQQTRWAHELAGIG